MDFTGIIKAIQDVGLAIVIAVLALGAVVYLFKLYAKSWEDRLAFMSLLRTEERNGRLEAEGRLASNSEALKEATSAFLASQRIFEALASARTDERPRRS